LGYNPDPRQYRGTERSPAARPVEPPRYVTPTARLAERLHWLKLRWFSGGCLLGLVVGVLFTLGASILAVSSIPIVSQIIRPDPDVLVTISENYLNREATRMVGEGFPTGVEAVTLKSVTVNVTPDNHLMMSPLFNVDAGFFNFDVPAEVDNQITAQEGEIAIAMVGNPKLGELTVPLDLLPFDLEGRLHQAVDKVNNDILSTELNDALVSGFKGGEFVVESVTTDEFGVTIRLRAKS
jgi:hypothetical protein